MRRIWINFALLGVVLFAADCGVVSIEDICLIDPSSCPSNKGTTTQYTNAALTLTPEGGGGFGSINVNSSSAAKTVTVTNVGGKTATLGTVTTSGIELAAPITMSTGTCVTSGTLASKATCTIILVFAPTTAGAVTDTLRLSYSGGAGTDTVVATADLTGTGVVASGGGDPGSVTISDGDTYDYGTVTIGVPVDKTFTVTNNMASTVTLDDSLFDNTGLGLGAPFTYRGGTCVPVLQLDSLAHVLTMPVQLAASATCTIEVRYTPSTASASSATLTVSYNDGTVRTATRAIQGTGRNVALLTISDGPTYDFGNVIVGSTSDHTFTVTNGASRDTATLGTVSTAGLALGGPYLLVTGMGAGTCVTGATLAAGASCTLVVQFSNIDLVRTPANNPDTITLTYNNGVTSTTATRDITGTSLATASLTISDQGFAYPTTDTGGDSSSKTFTVTAASGVRATATLGTVDTASISLAAPFTLTGGSCATGGTLAPGATCTLIVVFAPISPGAANDTISLSYNNGISGVSATNAISGSGIDPEAY